MPSHLEKNLPIVLRSIARSVSLLLVVALSTTAGAEQIHIDGPGGSGTFGSEVVALPNGNFLVIDPGYQGTQVMATGAIHLYSPDREEPISTLKGSAAGDFSDAEVTVLSNGNAVLSTPFWDREIAAGVTAADAGAVTWVNAATGRNGTISIETSLIGARANDRVGERVNALKNGNYVVRSRRWTRVVGQMPVPVGAITWARGTTGIAGEVSAGNSLVGTTNGDFNVARLTELPNGNVVLRLPNWDNGAAFNAGAAMWISGSASTTGEVTPARALVGTQNNDFVGGEVVALPQGGYFVVSPDWDRLAPPATIADVGAVTWRNGNGTHAGIVSPDNSLVGASASDYVGSNGAYPLANGKVLVLSPRWGSSRGAVTLISGTGPTSDSVRADNSLTGLAANDSVGSAETPTLLNNGHVVVGSPQWQGGKGAATWINASTGLPGQQVSGSNSLVGTVDNDSVGEYIVALANGNYVVGCPQCDRGGNIVDVGAATWGNGSTGTSGNVSILNSLAGLTQGDHVGQKIVPLSRSEGHYVVLSRDWDKLDVAPTVSSAGAATWVDGRTGRPSGAATPGADISVGNSLIGSVESDGSAIDVIPLSNGNYVVACPSCDRGGGVTNVGAVTWGNGATGVRGVIATTTSLSGLSAQDTVGDEVVGLTGGNYVVRSRSWDDLAAPGGAVPDAGAVTWVDGSNGRVFGNASLEAEITADNSLIGASQGDGDNLSVDPMPNGGYVATWASLDLGSAQDAGAISLGGAKGVRGRVDESNSLLGTVAGAGYQMIFDYSGSTGGLIVGQPTANRVTLFDDRLFRDSFE